MQRYPEGAWERAMKVQEVILRALAKRITWWQAAKAMYYYRKHKDASTHSR